MSIVVITLSSNRQDQTLSPSIALSLASLPFALILKPEMPMSHLFIPSAHTRALSFSHCIYRTHCVSAICQPDCCIRCFISHITVTSYLATGFQCFRGIFKFAGCYSQCFPSTAHHVHNIHTCSLSRPPVHSASVFSTAVSIRYIFASALLYSYSTYKSNTILLHLDCNVNTLR